MDSDAVSQIQTLVEKLNKSPDPHPVYPNWYHTATATKVKSIKTSLALIIEREYANSSMKDPLLDKLKGIDIKAWNFSDDLMSDIQTDLSHGAPPKKESGKPTVSNFIINQQTTTIDIIGLLEKAVESESVPEDQKKSARKILTDLKNDPVLSQLIACGITQLAAKAMGLIAGLPGK